MDTDTAGKSKVCSLPSSNVRIDEEDSAGSVSSPTTKRIEGANRSGKTDPRIKL